MRASSFYRVMVWLPLAVPAVTALLVQRLRGGGGALPEVVQLILMSGIYGGLPYLALALYATWWLAGRDELAIRRMAMKAPVLMAAVWLPFAGLIGVLSGRVDLFLGLAAVGAVASLLLGYTYVGIVLGLREVAGRLGRGAPHW